MEPSPSRRLPSSHWCLPPLRILNGQETSYQRVCCLPCYQRKFFGHLREKGGGPPNIRMEDTEYQDFSIDLHCVFQADEGRATGPQCKVLTSPRIWCYQLSQQPHTFAAAFVSNSKPHRIRQFRVGWHLTAAMVCRDSCFWEKDCKWTKAFQPCVQTTATVFFME